MSLILSLSTIQDNEFATFIPKRIVLNDGDTPVLLGREHCSPPTPETTAASGNGYFSSSVLSRKHAEVWAADGKIFIKDTQSVNGTFVNENRLEGDAAVALKTGDIVVLGVDVNHNNGLYYKVSAKVGIATE